MIRAEDLRKRYGDRVALDGVSFTVNAGEIVGLLGPNGAGKTTTLSILSGVIAPDSGRASIATHDLATDPRAAAPKPRPGAAIACAVSDAHRAREPDVLGTNPGDGVERRAQVTRALCSRKSAWQIVLTTR